MGALAQPASNAMGKSVVVRFAWWERKPGEHQPKFVMVLVQFAVSREEAKETKVEGRRYFANFASSRETHPMNFKMYHYR
jgi:hypothetical protein